MVEWKVRGLLDDGLATEDIGLDNTGMIQGVLHRKRITVCSGLATPAAAGHNGGRVARSLLRREAFETFL
jgi:hypothetical protein